MYLETSHSGGKLIPTSEGKTKVLSKSATQIPLHLWELAIAIKNTWMETTLETSFIVKAGCVMVERCCSADVCTSSHLHNICDWWWRMEEKIGTVF